MPKRIPKVPTNKSLGEIFKALNGILISTFLAS